MRIGSNVFASVQLNRMLSSLMTFKVLVVHDRGTDFSTSSSSNYVLLPTLLECFFPFCSQITVELDCPGPLPYPYLYFSTTG